MWELRLTIYKWMHRHTYTWVHSHLSTYFLSFNCSVNEQHTENKGQNQNQPSRNHSQLFCDTTPCKAMTRGHEAQLGIQGGCFQKYIPEPAPDFQQTCSWNDCFSLWILLHQLHLSLHSSTATAKNTLLMNSQFEIRVIWEKKNHTLDHELNPLT